MDVVLQQAGTGRRVALLFHFPSLLFFLTKNYFAGLVPLSSSTGYLKFSSLSQLDI